MLVMVYGKKRVKGNTGKNVYYTEGYQVDGNLYWSDDNFYRCKAPSPLNADTTYNLTDVQIWYPLRNCWIRCNWFTNLKCFGYDIEDLYERLKELERWRREEIDPWKSMIQRWKDEVVDPTLQNHGSRILALETWRTNIVDPFILNMSQWRTNVVEPHMQEINRWRSEDVDPFISSTNDWRNNVVNPTLSNHDTRIGTLEGWRTNVIEPYISALDTWRTSVGITLQNYETRISANTTNINTIFNRLTTLGTTLGIDWSSGTNALYSYITSQGYTNLKYLLDAKFTSIQNTLTSYYGELFDSGGRSRIGWLETEVQSLLDNMDPTLVGSLANLVDSLSQTVQTIERSLGIFIQDFNTYQGSVTTELNKIINRVNRNGDRGFATNGANGWEAVNRLNSVISWCNSQGASISPLNQTWYTSYSDPLPNIL